MNPDDPRHPWSRLTAAARRVRDDRDRRATGAPHGFATRVAALGLAAERREVSLLERFALRAVGAAGVLAILSMAVNYSALTRAEKMPEVSSAEEIVLPVDDAIAVALDFTG